MKGIKQAVSLLLAVMMVSGMMAQSVLAASNVCVNVGGSSKDYKWTTINVDTGKHWWSNTIKFTQTTGRIGYGAIESVATRKAEVYGGYTIKVDNLNDNKGPETYYWKYKENYTIKLEDNTKYTIQIRPYLPSTVGDAKGGSNIGLWILRRMGDYDKNEWTWYSAPQWSVKSTRAVSTCTVS